MMMSDVLFVLFLFWGERCYPILIPKEASYKEKKKKIESISTFALMLVKKQ